jgi:GNAT superfamily N-acetyltransferase
MQPQASPREPVPVRLATAADRAEMVPLINAAFAIETFLAGTRTDMERLTEMMHKGKFLLAHNASGELIASVYVESGNRRGYLGMLAVRPELQGRGLGRAMVEAAEEYCRAFNCMEMKLTVLSLRPELPPFYRKLGYSETGTEDFRPSRPLQPGVDCHCIVMSKSL